MAKKPQSPEEHVEQLVQKATEKANDPGVDLVHGDEVEAVGKSPETHATTSQNQRDFIPGRFIKDPTYVPTFVYDEDSGEKRRVKNEGDYHYVWVTWGLGGHINRFKNMGYRCMLYTGGAGGAEPGGFRGTGMFEPDANNHVVNGDTKLMFAPIRLFHALEEQDRQMVEKVQRAATEDFHNRAYNMGVRSFEEQTNQEEPGHPAAVLHN
jgi:hypothetical protein